MIFRQSLIILLSITFSLVTWAGHKECFEQLGTLLKHKPIKGAYHRLERPIKASTLEELEQLYGSSNFAYIYRDIHDSLYSYVNRITIEIASIHNVEKPTTFFEVARVFDLLKRIDRKVTEEIPEKVCLERGYCYGRATLAHMIATMQGVPQENMKKIWLEGDLKADHGGRWSYHVALAIKTNEDFWVLDSSFGLKRLDDFYYQFVERNVVLPLMFITQPTRIGPHRTNAYTEDLLFPLPGSSNYHHGYFEKAFTELEKHL